MKYRCVGAFAMLMALTGCVAALPVLASGAMGAGGLVGIGAIERSSSKGNMPRATAQAIGHNVDPQSIAVSNVHFSAHQATWIADTPIGRFQCSDDDTVRSAAYCKAM